MKEHPILFKTEMVQAILDDRKTQTRRVITPRNSIIGEGGNWDKFCWDGLAIYKDTCHHGHTVEYKAPLPFADGIKLHVPYNYEEDCAIYRIYPKWDIGDKLWVKETWCNTSCISKHIIYKASTPSADVFKWRPSIFLSRSDSRILLEITDIKPQRLQDITEEDAETEGVEAVYTEIEGITWFRPAYQRLWDSINKKNGYGWDKNDWVWVISFKVVSK